MNRGMQLRLASLCLALGFMGLLIVVVTLTSGQQARELRSRLSQVDTESFGFADRFKDSFREVSDKLRAYRADREPALWEEFLRAASELHTLVDSEATKLGTPREQQLLVEVRAAYDQYLHLAEELHAQLPPGSEAIATKPAELNRLVEQSRRLADLGQLLARAHYESRNALLSRANQTLGRLRLSVLGLLALLFVFGVGLALSVHGQMIAPLKVKLFESQAKVEQNEKLAALGMLAAGVAHEIRNPLTAIKAALFLHQKNFSSQAPERSDLQVVEREISRLERIVNQFLQFARPSDPDLEIFPADHALQNVERLLSSELCKTGIKLVREASGPGEVKADLAQIEQVLINLVHNAADSIDPPGTITLRARQDRKRLGAEEKDVVILEVCDTGRGIAPEVEKRLFDPFFTTKETGTGLGLSIAARIVEKHGGALQYQTLLNRGSTFGIVLPQFARA